MGQFVSNPTYIRGAILCFYVIFSRLFVASLCTMILVLFSWPARLLFFECLHRIGNRQESNFLYPEQGINFEISRCCCCCCCCRFYALYIRALFVHMVIRRRNFLFRKNFILFCKKLFTND